MPFAQLCVRGRQAVMSSIKKVFQHAKQVEIHKPGPLVEQKRSVQKHLFEWDQALLEIVQHGFFVRSPLVDAPMAELAFLVPDEADLLRRGNKFPIINIVQLKSDPFDLVFDIAPENGLHAVPLPWKQAKLEF